MSLKQNTLFNSFSTLRKRLSARPDTEHQQAIIRIVLTSIFLFTFINQPTILFLTSAYFIISVSILAWIIFSTPPSHIRKVIGIVGDMGMASSVLYLAGEAGILSLPVYLWVITGNGFRYGIKYLKISVLIAIVGVLIVVSTSPYWSQHYWISFVFLLTITAVPLYMAGLLKQLHQAITTAEEASQAKSQFLANMSHELRTPLGGIIGASDLLGMTNLNNDQKKYVHMIQSSGKSLLSLIEDVLDISKIEAGKLTSEIKPFDLHELITSIEQTFLPQAQKKGLKLASHVDPEIPFQLIGDELHLRQVLMNFLSNAMKFTHDGHVDLFAELNTDRQQKVLWVHFRVIDTGIGMNQASQENIFDSFVQADASITRKFGGTGLGTTISKELIELMGGKVGIHSEEGKGSEFWFDLPFQRQPIKPKEEVAAASFSEMRVLILLGEQLQNKVVTSLKRWGPEPTVLQDYKKFIPSVLKAHHSNQPYCVAIVDENTLSTTPQQFMKTIHAAHNTSHLAVILISTELEHHEHDTLLQLGYSAILSMPLNESLLFNALHEACSITKPLPHSNIISVGDRHKVKEENQKHCILIAEDNEVNQIVILELLKLAGYQTIIAEDGEVALDILTDSDHTFDMAILDVNMPNLSGLEVLKAYRFLEMSTHLPIIMLSADALSANVQECLDAGADGYLTKPIEHQKLLSTIDNLIHPNKKNITTHVQNISTTIEHWQHIDTSSLTKLKSITKKEYFIEGLIEKFDTGAQEKVMKLEEAIANQDTQTFVDICHGLMGGAGSIGATSIYQLCNGVEQQRQTLTSQAMTTILIKLKPMLRETSIEFSKFIQSQTNSDL